MLSDAITVELPRPGWGLRRLPGWEVWAVEERDDAIEVVAQYAATEAAGPSLGGAVCPRCDQPTLMGGPTWQVHQRHRQYKHDAPVWGKPQAPGWAGQVWILIWKRRFKCRACRYVFMEPDLACGRGRRTTARLRNTVAQLAEDATIRTVSRWHSVSEGLVQRSWLEAHMAPAAPPTPHVLIGLDGFCVRRPGAMWTGLWDLQTRDPIAVVAGERKADLPDTITHVTIPTLVVYADGDCDIFPSEQQEIFDKSGAADKAMLELAYADHYLNPVGAEGRDLADPRERLIDMIVPWIEARLGPASPHGL